MTLTQDYDSKVKVMVIGWFTCLVNIFEVCYIDSFI